jgi:hypothetical protein
VIKNVNTNEHKTKISKEKTMAGKSLYNSVTINEALKKELNQVDWHESRYFYCVTTNKNDVENTQNLSLAD